MKCEKRCKYCDTRIRVGVMCSHCREKLWKIRTIKAMLLGCTINEVIRIEEEKRKK